MAMPAAMRSPGTSLADIGACSHCKSSSRETPAVARQAPSANPKQSTFRPQRIRAACPLNGLGGVLLRGTVLVTLNAAHVPRGFLPKFK